MGPRHSHYGGFDIKTNLTATRLGWAAGLGRGWARGCPGSLGNDQPTKTCQRTARAASPTDPPTAAGAARQPGATQPAAAARPAGAASPLSRRSGSY